MTTLYKFKAFFTEEGVGSAPNPVPVATVLDTDTNGILADEQATTSASSIAGYYEYEYNGTDELDLVCLFATSSSMIDQKHLMSYVVDKDYILQDKVTQLTTGSATIYAQVDVPTSTRLSGSYIGALASASRVEAIQTTSTSIMNTKLSGSSLGTLASASRVEAIQTGVNQTTTGSATMDTKLNRLTSGSATADTKLNQITTGSATMDVKLNQLTAGSATINTNTSPIEPMVLP